jgi:hypothetical protein
VRKQLFQCGPPNNIPVTVKTIKLNSKGKGSANYKDPSIGTLKVTITVTSAGKASGTVASRHRPRGYATPTIRSDSRRSAADARAKSIVLCRLMRCWPALVIAAFLLAPATASAQRVEDTFFNSVIPSRVDHLIGFTPTTFAIHPLGQRVVPITVRVGGRTYRYTFGNAAAAVGPSANIYLRNMIRGRRYPSPQGIFLDRRLKAAERPHVRMRADLGRDADVLAVSSRHPACSSGVSRTAARGIAAGTIRTWSAAGVPTPASGDTIALRRAGSGIDRSVEPRFRASYKLPQGARAASDGGLSEAASGNLAIAAVTSWSRARAFQATTCAVPIGGSAPSDASVRALSHPDAYPIAFVTLKRLRQVRPIVAAFLKYLTGPRATDSFRQRGMLLDKEAWPTVPGPQG